MEIRHSITDDMLQALERSAIEWEIQMSRLVDRAAKWLDEEMEAEARNAEKVSNKAP